MVQRRLIDRAVNIHIRLVIINPKFAVLGDMTDYNSRMYLAWANSYSRLLRQLCLRGAPAKPQTLADIIGTYPNDRV